MAIDFEPDARALLAIRGQPVTYVVPGIGGGLKILNAMWDTSPEARASDGRTYAGRVWFLLRDLAPNVPAKNDAVIVQGITYRVANEPADQTDGAGGVFCLLRRA